MEEALGPDNTHTVKALPPTSWHLTTVFLWFARLVAVHTERAVRVGTRRVQCVACMGAQCVRHASTPRQAGHVTRLWHTCVPRGQAPMQLHSLRSLSCLAFFHNKKRTTALVYLEQVCFTSSSPPSTELGARPGMDIRHQETPVAPISRQYV